MLHETRDGLFESVSTVLVEFSKTDPRVDERQDFGRGGNRDLFLAPGNG